MNEMIKNEIKELTAKILEAVTVKKIFLFGSYAYGTPNNNSDIDLCVLTEENRRKIDILTDIRTKIGFSAQHPLDIIVYGSEEFYNRANSMTSIESQILRNGEIIYE